MSKITRNVQVEFIFHVQEHTELKEVNTYGAECDVDYVLNHLRAHQIKTEPGKVDYSPSDLSKKVIYNIYRGRSVHECKDYVHTVVLNFGCTNSFRTQRMDNVFKERERSKSIYRKLRFEANK